LDVHDLEPAAKVEEELEQLYRSEAERLLGFVILSGVRRADAEEIVNEAWMIVRVKTFMADPPRHARAYMYGTATTLSRKLHRESRRRDWEPLEPTNERLAVPDETGTVDDRIVLSRALDRAALPSRQREAFVLRDYFGFDLDEVAEVMGIAESTVKTHLQRARGKIARLRREDGEP
jgi:RNA polymerase sigma factor (sigma-70 family)